MDAEKEALINEIVERELVMFLATPNEGGPSDCQTRPNSFRAMRRMTHCAHGKETLASYLRDLKDAEAIGRNFMIEKYARMDDLIPPLSHNPLLDVITEIEIHFLEEATARYPHAIRVNTDSTFRRYFRCELETLSDRTLQLYADEMRRAVKEGRNTAVERYDSLWRSLGEGSLESYEKELAARGQNV